MSTRHNDIDTETIYECYECGNGFTQNADGTTHHLTPESGGWDTGDDLDYSHVAFGYVDCFICEAQTDTPASERGTNEHGEPLGVACDACLRQMDDEAREAEHQADLLDAAEKVW